MDAFFHSRVVAVTILILHSAAAFSSPRPPLLSRTVAKLPLSATPETETETETEAGTEKESLIFKADYEVVSGPVSQDKKEPFLELFATDKFRNYLLSAGGEREVKELPLDDEMLSFWREKCKVWCPEMLPEEDDTVLATDTMVHFPGLTLTTTAISGCKKGTSEVSGLPQYELVSIAEKQNPSGFAPVVWTFNKLTGNDKKQGAVSPSQGKIRSVLSAVPVEDSYAVCYDVDFQIEVVFSRILLRILPTTKEKAEQQGSAACAKAVSKDIEKGVAGLPKAFEKWL